MARRAPSMPQTGTAPEVRLTSALRAASAPEWEVSPEDFGRADLFWRHVLPKPVAVFVDGCSFHGCPDHGRTHGNPEHGLSKYGIARQKHKDRLKTSALAAKGVKVLRFWECEVDRSASDCAAVVMEALRR